MSMLCACGHDCARCVTYLATTRDDPALRKRAQAFYRETFGLEVPLEEIHCLGGLSEAAFALCRGCPFLACCRKRGLTRCSDCADYPCPALKAYIETYVNKCHQIDE